MTGLADLVVDWVSSKSRAAGSTPLLMLSGPQGSGKSTAAAAAQTAHDGRVAVLSLDDFYRTKENRRALAGAVHPLCETRGPPGTHDLPLLTGTVEALRAAGPDDVVSWPRFDKRTDDRAEARATYRGRPDAILLEGWLLGAQGDPAAPAAPPVNDLERERDPDGVWRRWQEDALSAAYADLWTRADAFLHIVPPDFSIVADWRIEQEAALSGLAAGAPPEARKTWVRGFVQHYERLTRRMAAGGRAPGVAVHVDRDRRPVDRSTATDATP